MQDIELLRRHKDLSAARRRITVYEAARALAWELLDHPDRLSDGLRVILEESRAIPRAV